MNFQRAIHFTFLSNESRILFMSTSRITRGVEIGPKSSAGAENVGKAHTLFESLRRFKGLIFAAILAGGAYVNLDAITKTAKRQYDLVINAAKESSAPGFAEIDAIVAQEINPETYATAVHAELARQREINPHFPYERIAGILLDGIDDEAIPVLQRKRFASPEDSAAFSQQFEDLGSMPIGVRIIATTDFHAREIPGKNIEVGSVRLSQKDVRKIAQGLLITAIAEAAQKQIGKEETSYDDGESVTSNQLP